MILPIRNLIFVSFLNPTVFPLSLQLIENSMCLLRNLSYQVHREIPGCERYQEAAPLNQGPAPSSQKGGCFSSRKSKGLSERARRALCICSFSRRNICGFLHSSTSLDWYWHTQAQTKHKLAHTGMSTISPSMRKLIVSPVGLCLCFTESIDSFFFLSYTPPSPQFHGFHLGATTNCQHSYE